MTKLSFNYEMSLDFEEEIYDHYFTLRCFPKSTKRQHILTMSHRVTESDMLCKSWDGFGNTTYIGHKLGKHKHFGVVVSGEAEIDWENYDEDTSLNMCYRMPSELTFISPEMDRYFEETYKPKITESTPYEMAIYIMHDIYDMFTYKQNVTNVNTGAAYAFNIKEGVCQDYAHVLIAFLRMANFPARYVAGLMEGEGKSHAWVEVFCNNRWYGLDPTNNMLVNNRYIIFSKGRDARDCMINQGKFYGSGEQKQIINARVVIEE